MLRSTSRQAYTRSKLARLLTSQLNSIHHSVNQPVFRHCCFISFTVTATVPFQKLREPNTYPRSNQSCRTRASRLRFSGLVEQANQKDTGAVKSLRNSFLSGLSSRGGRTRNNTSASIVLGVEVFPPSETTNEDTTLETPSVAQHWFLTTAPSLCDTCPNAYDTIASVLHCLANTVNLLSRRGSSEDARVYANQNDKERESGSRSAEAGVYRRSPSPRHSLRGRRKKGFYP